MFSRNETSITPEEIASYYNFPLESQEVDGVRYYAIRDWIKGVMQSHTTRQYWYKLRLRMSRENIDILSRCLNLGSKTKHPGRGVHYVNAVDLHFITQWMKKDSAICKSILSGEFHPSASKMRGGTIYVLHIEGFPNEYKIGSAKDINDRLSNYRGHIPPSCQIVVDFMVEVGNRLTSERLFHQYFKAKRISNEWYRLSVKDLEMLKCGKLNGVLRI